VALGWVFVGQGGLVLADGCIVRWTTRYWRFCGRGGGAFERNLGAEGLFEIEMEDEEKDCSRNTLFFQAWMGMFGYGEVLVWG
jgi:hypothetical protein